MFEFAFLKKEILIIMFITMIVSSCSGSSTNDPVITDVTAADIKFGDEIIVHFNSGTLQEILLGDIDNDADLDIVAVNQGTANVVYVNNTIFSAGGGFTATEIDPANALLNQSLSGDLGDIDGDMFIDLVTATQLGPNYAYINDRSGGFTSRVAIQADSDLTRTVKLADLDKNNTLDLYAGNGGVNKIYKNDGLGGFSPGVNIGVNADDTWSIKFADFDMSGADDMLAGNPVGAMCLHQNNGSGDLGECNSIALPGDSGRVLAVGDVDGDSDVDIIFANNSNFSQLYINDGVGNFTHTSTITSGTGFVTAAALGDLDGDNDLDYIAGTTGMPAGSGAQFPYIHLNNGLGTFDSGEQFGANGDDTTSIALGDIDGDGDLDIVMGKLAGPVVVYENLVR